MTVKIYEFAYSCDAPIEANVGIVKVDGISIEDGIETAHEQVRSIIEDAGGDDSDITVTLEFRSATYGPDQVTDEDDDSDDDDDAAVSNVPDPGYTKGELGIDENESNTEKEPVPAE